MRGPIQVVADVGGGDRDSTSGSGIDIWCRVSMMVGFFSMKCAVPARRQFLLSSSPQFTPRYRVKTLCCLCGGWGDLERRRRLDFLDCGSGGCMATERRLCCADGWPDVPGQRRSHPDRHLAQCHGWSADTMVAGCGSALSACVSKV